LYKANKKYVFDDSALLIEIDKFLLKEAKESERIKLDAFHPSIVSKGIDCELWWFNALNGKVYETNPESFSVKSIIAMKVGTGIHDKIQEMFYHMGILEGVYKCVRCGFKFWATSPDQCPECREYLKWHKIDFHEVPLDTGMIVGHADGLLNFAGHRKLLEIKSIKNKENASSKYGFELVVKQPLDEHYIQTQIYLDMWKETVKEAQNGMIIELLPEKGMEKKENNSATMVGARIVKDIEEALIIYLAKNTSEMRIFQVKRNYNSISFLMEKMKKIWKAYLEDNVDILEGLCYTNETIQRTRCKYRGEVCPK
jgi:hypothetical protein